MAEWSEARQLAAQYQSPGIAGIGFAKFASTGTVSPELWENIRLTESLAESNKGKDMVEGWAEDMVELRELLEEDGITEPKKVKLEISWTELTTRNITLEVELDEDTIEDLESGYGFSDSKWARMVQDKLIADGEGMTEMLHDEVDHIEVLEDEEDGDG